MVSQQRPSARSREKLLAAAAAEFAARGFAGAKVDRIASKARLNKAMIYYHFKNKAALYREVLVGVFATVADAVTGAVGDGPPEEQIRQFIHAVARTAAGHPHFASMWLREMADGGSHIDEAITTQLRRVLSVLGGILQRGRQSGDFHAAHPVVTQLGIVGPLLFFLASAPVRDRIARLGESLATPTHDDVIRHIEAGTLGALRDNDSTGAAPGTRVKRRVRT